MLRLPGRTCRKGAIIFPAGLLRYRLRWYALSTARLLLRRWQAIVLLLGVLASANASLFGHVNSLAYPVLVWLEPGTSFGFRLGYLMLLQALAVLWVFMQREQIGGGAFMRFAESLPFSHSQRRLVDIAVLVLADTPLLLLWISALIVVAAKPGQLVHLPLLCAVGLLALVAQVAVLERRFAPWGIVAAASLLLCAAIGTRFAIAASSLAGVTALALLLIRLPRVDVRFRSRVPAWLRRLLQALARRGHPALLISLGVLFDQRRFETGGKALGAACMVGAAFGLMVVFEFDRRAFGAALLAQGLVALNVSGMYRGLQMAHLGGVAYFGALPLPANWWRRFDVMAIIAFGLPFLTLLGLVVWLDAAAPGPQAIASVVSFSVLLGLLRGAQLLSERHAVFLSATLTACWTAATIGLLL